MSSRRLLPAEARGLTSDFCLLSSDFSIHGKSSLFGVRELALAFKSGSKLPHSKSFQIQQPYTKMFKITRPVSNIGDFFSIRTPCRIPIGLLLCCKCLFLSSTHICQPNIIIGSRPKGRS